MAKFITDRQAKAIRPGCKPIVSGITGMTLQPTNTSGRGKWALRFVSPETRKRRDMGLGVYPEVPVAEALAVAEAARKLIVAGRDPINARHAQHDIPTFEESARARWAQVAPIFRDEKHRTQWIRSLAPILDAIGSVRVDTLTPRHFADALEPMWNTTPETARRVKQRCHDVMATVWAEGHTLSNPLDVVDRLLPPQPEHIKEHQPAMPWADVPRFVSEHLQRAPVIGARAALLFLILTAARSGEVRGAMWSESELDARLWSIPAERMKAHRPHVVPLSDAAVNLLRQQRTHGTPKAGAPVFPAVRGGWLSDMALTSILRAAEAPSDTPDRVATAHGFRSSFKNWAVDSGFDGELSERALAHAIGNKVRAAYERTTQLDARRGMMDQWAAHVMGASANVMPLRARPVNERKAPI